MVKAQYRMIAAVLMGALLVILQGLWFVTGTDEGGLQRPPTALLVAFPVGALLLYGVNEVLGYRVEPLPPGTPREEATSTALTRFQAATMLRFALSESVAILSVAAAFVVESGGFVVAALGCGLSLLLMAVHVWPWRRPVEKTAASLEQDGADSGLREAFGMAPGAGGAIREL